MKRLLLGMTSLVFCLLVSSIFAADANSPVGLWKTIDDETGNPKAIVQVTENADHTLSGQIIKIFPRPGFDQHELCEACKGDKHNQPIVGMVILNHLQANKDDANEWVNGKILDPMNGRTYQCSVKLVDNNQKLKVRGFIGFALFGRSQTWVKEAS